MQTREVRNQGGAQTCANPGMGTPEVKFTTPVFRLRELHVDCTSVPDGTKVLTTDEVC